MDKKLLDKIGGVEYLLQLSESVPTTAHSQYYLKILNEKSLLRKLIQQSTQIIENAYGEVENINDFIGESEKNFLSVTRDRNAGEFKDVKTVIQNVTDRLVMLQKADGEISGVKTGYYDLDKLTSGFQKGDLIILAARPSVGKTAFALNVAYNVAYKADEAVAVFSLEMPAEQLIQRVICSAGSLKAESLRSGAILKESNERYYAAADKVSKCNLYIDDTPGIRVGEIAAKCRRLHRESGSRGHFLQVQQQVTAFFKQPVIPESNGREFFHGKIRVAHHRIEISHVNIADVTYQKDSLLYLACPFYEIVYGFQSIVVGLSLLVNLYSLLKVTSHVLCRCGSLYNFIGRVYNALSKVRRVYHCPLCFACYRKGQHCHE